MANPVDPRTNLPAISTGSSMAPLIPTNFREAMEMADVLGKSEMVPRAYTGKPNMIVVAIMHGLEVGLPPIASLQNIAVINGKPSLYGDGQLAVVMGRGHLEDIEETLTGTGDAMVARCRLKRRGIATEAISTFSVADAKKAGLWDKQGPWTQHPKRMLKFRARSFALRDLFADHLLGISAEEAADAGIGPDNARDITPERPRPTSRLDALEGIIEAEQPTPVTEAEPYNPETGEVTEPETEAQTTIRAWANKMIGQFDDVTDQAKIDQWLERNKDALAKARTVAPDAAMAVVAAADMRKRQLQQESGNGA